MADWDAKAAAPVSRQLLSQLAEQLEAAAATVRKLADAIDRPTLGLATGDDEDGGAEPDPLASLSPADWVTAARELHPALGHRQTQVLGEVAKAYPDGTGTGPIWKAIDYEQTNTYLALDALARQGLVWKDSSVRPHRYYLGAQLVRFARSAYGYEPR